MQIGSLVTGGHNHCKGWTRLGWVGMGCEGGGGGCGILMYIIYVSGVVVGEYICMHTKMTWEIDDVF